MILDFSLVLAGIDSSAAQVIIKQVRQMMRSKCSIDLCIFVSGSDISFPCEFPPLTGKLPDRQLNHGSITLNNKDELLESNPNEVVDYIFGLPKLKPRSYVDIARDGEEPHADLSIGDLDDDNQLQEELLVVVHV